MLSLVAYGLYHLAITADSAARQTVAAVPDQMMPKPKLKITHPVPPKRQTSNVPAGNAGVSAAGAQTQASAAQSAGATANSVHVYGQQNGDAHVVLRVKQTTRILVQGESGKIYINRALEPGDTYQVPNLPGLLLTAQHGNAVEIDLDGQAMGLAGTTGDLSEALPLDPQAVADRYGNGHPG